MEAMALANTVVPETAMSDMCGEAAGERHVPQDPRSAHPASRSKIPVSSHSQSANLLADAHNMVSVQSNQQAARSSTNPMTSVSLPSNQNLLVDYLREFEEEKDKAICNMSKTQLKLFGLISNGKCVNGVPYSDPTQFLSCSAHFLGNRVYAKGFSRLILVNLSSLRNLATWGGWRCPFSASLLI